MSDVESSEYSLSKMRSVYNENAMEYAQSTHDLSYFPGLSDEISRFYTQSLKSHPVLDLGCGTGRDCMFLRGEGATVVAADLSEALLYLARQRCSAQPALGYTQLTMTRLPFAANSFGGVWACASMLHTPISMLPQAISEVARVLAPGGIVAISMKAGSGEGWFAGTTFLTPRWFTLIQPPELEKMLGEAGLERTLSIPSGRKNWFVTEAFKAPESAP